MIKMWLIWLLKGAGQYVVYQIPWQWSSLLAQIVTVWNIARLTENAGK